MIKVKNITKADLLEIRSNALEERQAIASQGEDSTLTAEQVSKLEQIRSDVAMIDAELDSRAEAERRKATEDARNAKSNTYKRASLVQVLGALAGVSERTEEVDAVLERGRKQMSGVRGVSAEGTAIPINFRAGNATVMATEDPGKSLVGETGYLLDAQTSDLVFARAGATMLTGLTDNVKFNRLDLPRAVWEDEVAPIAESEATNKGVTLSPKRLGIVTSISKRMLAQDTNSINAYLQRLMVAKVYEALEQSLLASSSVAKGPKSLLDATAYADIKSAGTDLSYKTLVAMQGVLADQDALKGNLAYIGTPLLRTTLKTIPIDANQSLGFVLNDRDGLVAGYPIYATSLAKADDGENIVFGNWLDFVIAQWGALDIAVDPYSQADMGKVRLVINSYWDAAPINQESFAKAHISIDSGAGA